MRLAIVVEAVPNPGTVGSDVVSWAILEQAVAMGHAVSAYCLVNQWAAQGEEGIAAQMRALERRGVRALALRIPPHPLQVLPRGTGGLRPPWLRGWREAGRVSLQDLYPSASLIPELRRALAAEPPDAILGFDTGTVVALEAIPIAPRLAIPGDPPHLVEAYRERFVERRPGFARLRPSRLVNARRRRRIARLLLDVLRRFESVGYLGAQHAAWAASHGIRCLSLRPPVADAGGSDWRTRRASSAPRVVPKIVWLGNLGTASLSGMRMLVRKTIPALERRLGPRGFEVHLVGRGAVPEELRRGLNRPAVRLRGYVEDAAAEFLSADIFLVPTPYPIGVRTRIAEAFSYGCCVVTHPASAAGLPELRHGENVLMARDGDGWAAEILRALSRPALRVSLAEAARRTYETVFSPQVAARQMIHELERIARQGRAGMTAHAAGVPSLEPAGQRA